MTWCLVKHRDNFTFYQLYLKGRDRVRPTHRWEDNIRMDFRELGWEVVDWIHLTYDRDQ